MKTDQEKKTDAVLALIGLTMIIPSCIWRGYVLTILWEWFIVPSFGAPLLRIPAAIGMALVVSYYMTGQTTNCEDKRTKEERFATSIGLMFFMPATNTLRPRLIAEELHELRVAIDASDRLEQLDALADSQYVLSGAVLAWGMRAQFDPHSITMRLRKIHFMDAHLAEMFGLNAMMESAAIGGFKYIVSIELRNLQSRLSQLVWTLGFSECFSEAFAEVHRSNLSKLWTTEESEIESAEIMARIEVYSFEEAEPDSGKWIARRSDGKIVKSPSYSPASLERFI